MGYAMPKRCAARFWFRLYVVRCNHVQAAASSFPRPGHAQGHAPACRWAGPCTRRFLHNASCGAKHAKHDCYIPLAHLQRFSRQCNPLQAQAQVQVHSCKIALHKKPTLATRSITQVGWFLHTPFPSSEIYRTLPVREEVLRSVLGADLIGFHTYDYARHFISSCTRILGLEGGFLAVAWV